jgi:hypothetical protein
MSQNSNSVRRRNTSDHYFNSVKEITPKKSNREHFNSVKEVNQKEAYRTYDQRETSNDQERRMSQ